MVALETGETRCTREDAGFFLHSILSSAAPSAGKEAITISNTAKPSAQMQGRPLFCKKQCRGLNFFPSFLRQ